jgi:hypothetical protein
VTSVSQASTVSINFSQTMDSITGIAIPASRHFIYCVGTVGGSVGLWHMQSGKLTDVRAADGLFGIDKMALSRDGKRVCFTDSVKTLVVASINYDDKNKEISVKQEAEISLSTVVKGSILDLLFH